MTKKNDLTDPFGDGFIASSIVSIERLCELDLRVRELCLTEEVLDDVACKVKEVLKDYTSEELATYLSRLCVITDQLQLNQAVHHHMLSQERTFYARIHQLKKDHRIHGIPLPKLCRDCPASVRMPMQDPDNPAVIRQKSKCVFLRLEIPEHFAGRLHNCPFFKDQA